MRTVMMVLVGKRRDSAVNVQEILTEYGCYIKTRLGLHEASESVCAEEGLILLELLNDKEKQDNLFTALKAVECIDVKMVTLSVDAN